MLRKKLGGAGEGKATFHRGGVEDKMKFPTEDPVEISELSPPSPFSVFSCVLNHFCSSGHTSVCL